MDKKQQTIAIAIFCISFLLNAAVSVINPLFEAPDESGHYVAAVHILQEGGLPVITPENVESYNQEDTQGPLFYAAAAALTFWIDRGDYHTVHINNPHGQIGHANVTDNINAAIHTRAERFPWRGTALAMHILRFFNSILGALTVVFTYLAARLIWRERHDLPLLAAALVGLNPMFIFISGACNNDILPTLFSTIGIYLAVKAVQQELTIRWSITAGIIAGLGALSKLNGLSVIILIGFVLIVKLFQKSGWKTVLKHGLIIGAIFIAVAGWWFLRNALLYQDAFALNIHMEAIGGAHTVTSNWDLRRDWSGPFKSYWGVFGMLSVPMDTGVYYFYMVLVILGVLGFIFSFFKAARDDRPYFDAEVVFGFFTLLLVAEMLYWMSHLPPPSAQQGRLFFPAITSNALILAAGFRYFFSDKNRLWAYGLIAPLAAIAILAPFLYIIPAFHPYEEAARPADPLAISYTEPGDESPSFQLLAVETAPDSIHPGENLRVTLTWECLKPTARPWSLFIHLQDSAGLVVGQKDSYLGEGMLLSTEIEPGMIWTESYEIPVKETAFAPETLTVSVGFYDAATCPDCERMTLEGGGNAAAVASVPIIASGGVEGLANALAVNFSDQLMLTGYDLSTRTPEAGETLTVSLDWQALGEITQPLHLSLQVLDQDYTVIGQVDGEVLTSGEGPQRVDVPLTADAEAGRYNLWLIIYTFAEDGAAVRLSATSTTQNYATDFYQLTELVIAD